MANSNISSIGRFSSQMLSYLGTQRSVQVVDGVFANVFTYPTTSNEIYPSPSSAQLYQYGVQVVGNISPTMYDNIKCFFLSRGASSVYADTMTALVADISTVLNVSPQALLESSEVNGQFVLANSAYQAFNELRDPANQIGQVTPISNRNSLSARQILP